MHKKQLIYIMGAGRSGTTALSAFLGNNNNIQNIGEIHQLLDYLDENKECSCGSLLNECDFWSKRLSKELLQLTFETRDFSNRFESHFSILKHLFKLFNKKEIAEYKRLHSKIFKQLALYNDKAVLLDSSKYIGRALSLNKLEDLDLKVIYVVRDVRGVINSFSKKVQTPKHPFSTIFYYLIVNSIASFIAFFVFRKKVIKIRYEDLIESPISLFEKLEQFLKLDLEDIKNKIKNKQVFEIGHIIGGNRIKSNKEIYLSKDVAWRQNFNWIQRLLYYILAAPIMMINRYRF